MKKIIMLCALALGSQACGNGDQVLKTAVNIANQIGTTGTANALTNDEVIKGLKEALIQGTTKGSTKLNAVDGFFKDAAVKILLPPDALKAEQKLRELGMGNLADKAILSINRAAENAALQAKPIFVNAISAMTIQDAMGILKGGNTSATDFLKRATTAQLTAAFNPVIKQSLDKVNATKYWTDVISTYNQLPLVQKINPNLTDFVTQRAIEGVFLKIADEEKNIRLNPVARTTAILQKVFGAVAQK